MSSSPVVGETQAVNIQDASPKRLLILWANTQDAWLRSLVANTILTRNPPTPAEVDDLFKTFRAEKKLTREDEEVNVPLLELDGGEESSEEALVLKALNHIQGVNALVPDSSVEFDDGLTILFGQNASGKTGYARIIKRLAAVRTAGPILPNAHAAGPQPDPSATVSYQLGTEAVEVEWQNEAGLAPFTRIAVFDAPAANLHVDNELNYVFTPAELALFSHVSAGIHALQEKITAEVERLRPSANVLLEQFSRGTAVYPLIESLGPTTEVAELERLAALDDRPTERRSRLQEEVSALRGGALDALLTSAQQRQTNLERLRDLLQVIGRFDFGAYREAREGLIKAESERRQAREELFAAEELPGPPDDDWQKLVVAGENYRQHLQLHSYPEDGDRCLYCRQHLSAEALDLLGRYRTFMDESFVRLVRGAGERVDRLALRLDTAAAASLEEYLTALEADAGPAWTTGALSILRDGVVTAAACRERKECPKLNLADRAEALLGTIVPELEAVTASAASLREQRTDRATTLERKERELNELSARIDLKKHLQTAKNFVANAKLAARLEQLSRNISSNASRQLTEQAKLASEDLVNKNFERLFLEECKALRAPSVALEFQGRSGRAERRKVVAAHRPSEILSEGEQKVLALADFLAESRMRGTKAPIVFDDPVTSLDYRRLREVSLRIVKLAESHQVIVFTHNIMFASSLIDLRQAKKLRCRFYEVRESGEAKGILAADVEPRLDTPADISKRINVTIEQARTAEAAVQDALVERGYDLVRAWCEAFVEQDLLGNVTQRYRANIMMTKLTSIRPDRFSAAVAVVGPIFEKACRCMGGHSQPAEQLSVRPTLSELQADWAQAQEARKVYLAP
jgi:hypothetical protein